MKILFVHQNFPGQFRHLAVALAAEGHEVVALGVRAPEASFPGIRHLRHRPRVIGHFNSSHPLAQGELDWLSKQSRGDSAARAMRQLRGEGFTPDVVVAHPGWGEALFAKDVFPGAKLLIYAEFFYGGDMSDTTFDPEFAAAGDYCCERARMKNTHLLHALSEADAMIFPTQFQRQRHPAWAQQRIQVIHDGIDTDRFKPDPHASVHLKAAGVTLKPGDEVVTFVARNLEPYRGYHIFMRALPLLQQLRPRCRVVIVGGDGVSYGARPPEGRSWREIFKAEVAQHLDYSRLHFVGKLPHDMLTRLMQVSAAHVYLTYPFVLSWSLLEAMSIGCLVVASDTAPVREVIEDGRTGFLTDFFDMEMLAKRVADVLDRRPSFVAFGEAARREIQSGYDLYSRCLPA
ncbi:MAG: glycosyltransferase, partial [Caulobacter sp.]|nr:glycosyltransferase [Vitreoscilla sp.]